jgi:hypothetical protein
MRSLEVFANLLVASLGVLTLCAQAGSSRHTARVRRVRRQLSHRVQAPVSLGRAEGPFRNTGSSTTISIDWRTT